jgi:hypothetical protein
VNAADPTGPLVLMPSSQTSHSLYSVLAVRPVSVIPTLVSLPVPVVGTLVVVLPLDAYPVALKPCRPLPTFARSHVGVLADVKAEK